MSEIVERRSGKDRRKASPPSPEPLGWVVVGKALFSKQPALISSRLATKGEAERLRDATEKKFPQYGPYTVEPVGQRGRTDE